MASSDNVFNIGLLAIVAYVLFTMGIIKVPSSEVTSACPRGKSYTRGLWPLEVNCDSNYTSGAWNTCNCATSTAPATTPNVQPIVQPEPSTAHPSFVKPITPTNPLAPNVCLYNSNLLAGDSRCVPSVGTPEQGGIPLATLEPWNPAAPFYDFIGRP